MRRRATAHRPFLGYLAWQAPGWLVAAGALFWLRAALGIATWLVVLMFILYVGKDLLLYPALRGVLRPPSPAAPIGRRGHAVERLAPAGHVRVNGELWNARTRGADVAAGGAVLVLDAEGLTLIVEKV